MISLPLVLSSSVKVDAEADLGLVAGGFDDHGVLALLAQLEDPRLEKRLVVLGGVVLGVLFEVAVFTCDRDLRGNFWALHVLERFDLCFEFVVGGLGHRYLIVHLSEANRLQKRLQSRPTW